MSTAPLALGFPELLYRASQTGRTCRASHGVAWANAANDVALAHFAERGRAENCQPNANAYRIGYTKSTSCRTVRVAWYYRGDGYYGQQLSVDLSVTDGTNTVLSTNARIPDRFKAEAVSLFGAPIDSLGARVVQGGEGWIDVTSGASGLGSTLTASADWSFNFVVARPLGASAYVDFVTLEEVPRGIADTTDTYGVIPGSFNPGVHITSGDILTPSPDGFERLIKTVEGGRLTQRSYLNLAWVSDITAAIPQTTAAAYAALTNLDDGAGVAQAFRVRVRNIAALAAAGERCRFRVLYYVAGGGTGDVRLATGATGSPFNLTGLTGAAWAWSGWKECYLATNGTNQTDTATFTAQVTAGSTLYLAAIQLDENVA